MFRVFTLIAALALSAPLFSASFVVTTLIDSDNPNDGQLSLREAIALSNAQPDADVITFSAALVGAIVQAPALPRLRVAGTVSINGDRRITLVAGGLGALWLDDQNPGATATVTLLNLTVANGPDIGAIDTREHLTLENVTFKDNGYGVTSDAVGGAPIPVLTIRDSLFEGSGQGAQAFIVDISNTTFRNTSSTVLPGTQGRALQIEAGEIADSLFEGNDTGVFARPVSIGVTPGLNLRNVTMRGNGVGIDNAGPITVTNSNFENNELGVRSDGSFDTDVVATIVASQFRNNSRTTGSSAGAFINGTGVIRDSQFIGNTAESCAAIEGPGLGPSTLTIENTTIRSNRATRFGGGACGQLVVKNSTIENNKALQNDGGGLYLRPPSVVRDSEVSGNTAAEEGGGVFITGNGAGGDTFVINTTISQNTSDLGGGGIKIDGTPTDGRVFIRQSTIARNESKGGNSGGGLLQRGGIRGEPTQIRNTIIALNTFTATLPPNVDPNVFGQDIFSDVSFALDLDGNNLIGNSTGGMGAFAARLSNLENVDPELGPLASNGGPTQTHALSTDSPGVGRGNSNFALDETGSPLANDQRGPGFGRIQASAPDIGAYESSLPGEPGELEISGGPGNSRLPRQIAGTPDVVAMHLKLKSSSGDSVVVDGIRFSTKGDGDDTSGIDAVKLFRDDDGDGVVDPADPQLGATNFFDSDNGAVTFSLNETIPSGQEALWILAFDLSDSACLCEDYLPKLKPADVTARLSLGGPATVTGNVTGRFVEIDGGTVSIAGGNNQRGVAMQLLDESMVVEVADQLPACGPVEYSVLESPDDSPGMFANGSESIKIPLDLNNQSLAPFTIGAVGGTYKIRAQLDTAAAATCTTPPDFVDFTHTAVGLKITDDLQAYRDDETRLRTFLQDIEAVDNISVELDPALPGFVLESVTFDLAGENQVDSAAPFTAPFDMQNLEDSSVLTVSATINTGKTARTLVAKGEGIPFSYPVRSIDVPAWFNTIEVIAEDVTSEFAPAQRRYDFSFAYPTDFVWDDAVDTVVALLGGEVSDLGEPGFRLFLDASYDLDSNSVLSSTIERDIKIYGRDFTVFGNISAGFDQEFRFNTPDDPVGSIGLTTSQSLGEKRFARTILVYAVPITAAIDLAGEASLALVGRIYLNENLEFSQFLISPEPSIQLNVAASISAVFGLAKLIASATPTAAAQIHLPYSSANGIEAPRFGGSLDVELSLEGSLFYGLASGQLGTAMLGPYTWGDFIKSQQLHERWTRLQATKGSLGTPSTFISTQDLAGNNAGQALYVFTQDAGTSSPDPELYFQFDDGSGYADAMPLSGSTTPDARWEMDPAVVFLGGGDGLAVWTSNRGAASLTNLNDILASQEIAWSAWDSGSQTWTAPVDLTQDSQADGSAALAYNAGSDEAAALWVHDSNTANGALERTDWDIHFAIYDGASETWTAPAAVVADSVSDYMPAVAASGSTFMALWSEDDDGQLFVDPGLDPDEDGTIANGTNVDSTNTDARLVYAIYSGGSWSSKNVLYQSAASSSYTQMADVVGTGSGDYVGVWVDKQNTNDLLLYAIYSGGSWGSPQLVVESEQFIEDPDLTYANGEVTVFYRSYDATDDSGNGYAGNLFSQVLTSGVRRAKGDPAPVAITRDNLGQMFVSAANVGDEVNLAWFERSPIGAGAAQLSSGVANDSTVQAECVVTELDFDSDGLVDLVNFAVDLFIDEPGEYALVGDLNDPNGQFVLRANSEIGSLSTGNAVLNLSFPASRLGQQGSEGPFELTQVHLLAYTPAGIVVNRRDNLCTTDVLPPEQLEAPAFRFDQTEYNNQDTGAMLVLDWAPSNQASGAIETVTVKAWGNLDTTGIEVELIETAADSGIFVGSFTFNAAASDDAKDRLRAQGGTALVASFEATDINQVFTAQAAISADLLLRSAFE